MSTALTSRRIPLNTFAISFGLAGLAEIWTTAGTRLGWSPAISWTFWMIATIVWLALIVAHLIRGARTNLPLRTQLRDPAQGPIAALVPVFAMLLGTTIIPAQPVVGRTLALAGIIAAALYAGWLLALWMRGDRPIDALHGGYFLPTVAAGFIGATAAHAAGLPVLAYGSFAVAILFWVAIQTLLLARLATRPALPGPLVPSLAIMAAPPAVGGIAWFELTDGRFDHFQEGLAGLAVLMLLIQLFFIPLYRRTPFSLGYWSFTFSFAANGTYGILWATRTPSTGGDIVSVLILTVITVLIVGIAVRSVAGWAAGRRHHTAPELAAVTVADDQVDESLAPEGLRTGHS